MRDSFHWRVRNPKGPRWGSGLGHMYFLYILQSEKTKRFYIGSCVDVQRRLIQHNRGGTPSTKPYRPWKIIYVEQFDQKNDATKREWFLKHPPGYLEKKRIIEQYGIHGGFA